MNQYKQYRDSGVDWIGDVPSHWSVERTKYRFQIVKLQVPHTGQEILSITQSGIRPKNVAENEGQMAQNYDGYQEVHIGDFAMNSMDLLTGWVDLSQYEGLTSPDYRVFAPVDADAINPTYFKYVFQLLYTRKIYYKFGQGVSNLGRWRLQKPAFLNFLLPVPPLIEQDVIAKHLDSVTAEIDDLKTKLSKQRTLLDKYKRQLIAETVTRGIDPDAPMVATGEEWIGRIPKHWNIVPLRSLLRRNSEKGRPDWRLLSVERERGVVDRLTDGSANNHNRVPEDLSDYKVVHSGQFVMNKMKAWQGSYGVSAQDGIVSPAYYVFDLDVPVPDYFNWAIRSSAYIGYFGRDSYGIRTDQWDFKAQALKSIPFAVPPEAEQRKIADYLSVRVTAVDGLKKDIDRQVELLEIYRRQLINDVVTGKIRVSEDVA